MDCEHKGDRVDSQGNRTVTLTRAEVERMGPEAFQRLILAGGKVRAKGVVRRADGSIKYDDPSKAGQYGEEHLT